MSHETNELAVKKVDSRYGFDPSYLSPPSSYKQIQHTADYVIKGDGKTSRRKIYHGVVFSDFEKQGIQQFRAEIEKAQISLPSEWTDIEVLKMAYTARFNYKECLKKLESHLKWYNDPSMHQIDDKSRVLLENGFIYVHGRDKNLRPVVVLNVLKLNLKETPEELTKSVSVILDMVRAYMFRPYHIENWVMIIDLGNKGVFSLPINALKQIIGSMATNYCATLEKMFILNPPWIVKQAWNMIEGFMDPETAAKIRILDKKEFAQITEQVPAQYLEKKFGGLQEDISSGYWPPRDLYQAERRAEEEEQLRLQQQQELKLREQQAQQQLDALQQASQQTSANVLVVNE